MLSRTNFSFSYLFLLFIEFIFKIVIFINILSIVLVGRYSTKIENKVVDDCISCPAGFNQELSGNPFCLPCLPGRFASINGSVKCQNCPDGYLQPENAASNCKVQPIGSIVLGGSSSVQVPLGAALVNGGTSFETCSAGTFGNNDRSSCNQCAAGMTSFSGSTSCIACTKGKFNNETGSSTCHLCERGQYQSQEIEPSYTCHTCPFGFSAASKGSSFCVDLKYVKKQDCSESEYLNNTDLNPVVWKCDKCPAGASW